MAVVLLAVACSRPWKDAEEFRGKLACGDSAEEIRQLAASYDRDDGFGEFSEVLGDSAQYFLSADSTEFRFWMADDTLEWYEESLLCGWTCATSALRINLCTGERTGYPTIRIMAPGELKGAETFLDGEKFYGFNTGPGQTGLNAGVPIMTLGLHTIRIEKVGFEPIEKSFVYQPTQYWPEITEIVIEIASDDLRPR